MRISVLILTVLCLPMVLSAQVVNDECSDAIVATLGSNAIDTTEATNSPEANPEAICPGTALGGFYSDVWYHFTPTEDGLMTITTCDTVDFDTDVAVYGGLCGALIPIACYGDSGGCLV
ncbi:MAG: hypothetical protein VYD70_00930, partial [Planctomycetota bacterium]|nr:hypothetical protein [Planctomycetota bacterium]